MNKRIKIKKGLLKKSKKLWCCECSCYTNHILLESSKYHSECLRCGIKHYIDDVLCDYQCPECLTYPKDDSYEYSCDKGYNLSSLNTVDCQRYKDFQNNNVSFSYKQPCNGCESLKENFIQGDYLGMTDESYFPTGLHTWTSKFKCHNCGYVYEIDDSN